MEMYSLYRAWLHFGTTGLTAGFQNVHPLQQLPPGVNQPPSAPDVSLQVGPSMTHFSAHKAILSAHSGYFKAALVNHADADPISVPNVNVDEFSYLLTFMYTGYLDLNIRNIYNILLATHILHMPAALEICRSFLLHTQQNAAAADARTNVIKPIASRKALVPTQPIFAPHNTAALPKSEDTPFTVVRQPEKLPTGASTSKEIQERDVVSSALKRTDKKCSDKSRTKRRSETCSSKVIIDVACCDGPVRFHRVVNKNYGLNEGVENRPEAQEEVNTTDAMNKAMAENIRDKPAAGADENATGNELFTCLYCNHTFKSQYCYQKHARRHLNPVGVEAKAITKELKREVKLLDMNVQYYPCKTCGSKFPSYYFVHKHRKMCHAEEMADLNNRNNEIVAEGTAEADGTSSNSSIDVEALNSDGS